MQEQNVDMTPEEAKASLGLATRLNEQFLMMQNPQMAEEPVTEGQLEEMTAPTQHNQDPIQIKDEIMAEVQNLVKTEIYSLREDIKNALNEEE